MVMKGDFEIQLVQAVTKEPFLEHRKGEDVYCEVEPEVEYFIAVRKVRASRHRHLYCEVHVDGEDLGYYRHFLGTGKTECCYLGTYSRVNRVGSNKALKFMKPKEDKTVASTALFTGKVEFCVYEGKSIGIKKNKDFSTSIDMECLHTVDEDKILRTTEGHTLISKSKKKTSEFFRRGAHLYTITLHYCTTPGLIMAGILRPSPDSTHLKKRSASFSRTWMKSFPTPKRISLVTQSAEVDVHDVKLYDYFDLSAFSSGDDDDDSSQEEEAGTQNKALEGTNGTSIAQDARVVVAAGKRNRKLHHEGDVSGTKKEKGFTRN